MSLVLIHCEERVRDRLTELVSTAGYGLIADEEAGEDLAAALPRLLEKTPDLAVVVTEATHQNWAAQVDAHNLRYWLVEVGSPSGGGLTLPARQPHRHLLGLDRAATEYLVQLLDDWRDREVIRVDCFTFAYRHGLPAEADWVVDTRFLDSPYWDPAMRDRDGRDPELRRRLMTQSGAHQVVERFLPMLIELLPLYQTQRRSVLRVAVGCTGGKHRSVAIAAELVERINQSGQAEARHLRHPPRHLPQLLD
jgi:hypothetical protein